MKTISSKLKEMLSCNNFRELINNYGNEKELFNQYQEGLLFAPDKKIYIENRIKLHEEALSTFSSLTEVKEKIKGDLIPIQFGDYKRLGFAWVNNGHNATKEDLEGLVYKNMSIEPYIVYETNERKNLIHYALFQSLAQGGALAFHMAFLRKELNSGALMAEKNKTKKAFPAKFYALYHWIKIEMGTENQFVKNYNDQFNKKEIEAFAKNAYPGCSPQGFYRSFKEIDITNKTALAKSLGEGYKEKLIAISNNDNKLITHLKNYPN